jgi:hypothetical protein
MALQKTLLLTNNFGTVTELSNCYIKVDTVSGDKNRLRFGINIMSGPSGSTYDRQEHIFTPSMDGGNFIKQAYEHLKTLPEFSDAEDV